MPERNQLFEAVRGIAAIAVVALHLGNFSYGLAPSGFLAVDVFFVMSGFVIAQAYEVRRKTSMSFQHFMALRLIRLYPLICLGFVLGLAKALFSYALHQPTTYTLSDIIESAPFNFLLLPAPPGIGDLFPLNGPAWSLFFEILAYIFFARFGYRLSNTWLVNVVLFSGFLMIAVALSQSNMDVGWNWDNSLGGVGRVGYGFTLGHLMFRVAGARQRKRSLLAFIPLFAVSAVLVFPPSDSWRMVFWIAAAISISPAIIIMCSLLELPQRFHGTASLLGELSYPLYAIHFPLLTACKFVLLKLQLPLFWYPFMILPTLLFIAYCASRFFDAPIRKWVVARLAMHSSVT